MNCKSFVPAVLLALLISFSFNAAADAGEYQHALDIGKMNIAWSVDGDQLGVKMSAPTTGWVAVGFNPSSKMKDADIIIGYVKKGTVTVKDEFGTAATQHKSDSSVGGTENVTVIGGTEEAGVTSIEFSIPLKSGDAKDSALDPNGDTVVIVAYGPERDSFRTKHKFRDTVTVNLSTGEKK